MSDSFWLQGVDGEVCDHADRLPDQEILDRRACYCHQWQTQEDRKHLLAQSIPEGFCGKCQVCGEPGHMCHYPGPVPFTGAWCDTHYIEEARTKKMVKRRHKET